MSFTIIDNAVIDKHFKDKKFVGAPMSVYIALRRRSDANGKKVFPSYETIAEDTGYSMRHVKRAIAYLEEIGLIIIEKKMGKRGFERNIYHFIGLSNSDTHVTSNSDTHVPGVVTPMSPGWCHGSHPNNTNINNTKDNNNIAPPIKRETIVREYETQQVNLDDVVVAILKNLKVDQSFWPSLNGMETNRVQALSELAKKKATKNPGGWFRKAVEGAWEIPGVDKRAFEMQCDLIRKTRTHLLSKVSGKEYEIDRFKTGAKIVIHTDDRGDVVLSSEKSLEDFIYV